MNQTPDTVVPHQLPIGFPHCKAVGPSVRGFVWCIMVPDVAPDSEYRSTDPTLTARHTRLEYTNRFAHRALDVQRFDVLPVLLQE